MIFRLLPPNYDIIDHYWTLKQLSSLNRHSLFLLDNNKILIVFIISFGLAALLLFLSYFLSFDKYNYEDKSLSYECGFDPFNDSRSGFDIHYYLVAILFIIFDLEIMFLFPWAFCLNDMLSQSYLHNGEHLMVRIPNVRFTEKFTYKLLPNDVYVHYKFDCPVFEDPDLLPYFKTCSNSCKVFPHYQEIIFKSLLFDLTKLDFGYFLFFTNVHKHYNGHYFVLIFLSILIIGLIYEWKKGGLDW